jgi:hypothetical protein
MVAFGQATALVSDGDRGVCRGEAPGRDMAAPDANSAVPVFLTMFCKRSFVRLGIPIPQFDRIGTLTGLNE